MYFWAGSLGFWTDTEDSAPCAQTTQARSRIIPSAVLCGALLISVCASHWSEPNWYTNRHLYPKPRCSIGCRERITTKSEGLRKASIKHFFFIAIIKLYVFVVMVKVAAAILLPNSLHGEKGGGLVHCTGGCCKLRWPASDFSKELSNISALMAGDFMAWIRPSPHNRSATSKFLNLIVEFRVLQDFFLKILEIH